MLQPGVSGREGLGVRGAGGGGGASSSGEGMSSSTHVHERPALNTLLPGMLSGCPRSAQVGKAQPPRAAGEAEAERGPHTFSSSPVCHDVRDPWQSSPVWSPKVDCATWLLAGQPFARHVTCPSP